ncbi:MAG: TIR domain-containing protein [Holdemanella porci]|uniref:TIR domain-containing protein n=1 Tax=Holdemanella TaxID=1573535 RepID=UPI0039958BC7
MIYNLFINHSWAYGDAYDGLINLLNKRSYFEYRNYSVPKNDPIHNAKNDSQLRTAIRKQMQPVSCVLILAGVYSTYSKWINIEIELAKEMGKRIIAIEPWASQKTSQTVKNNADVIVGWNTESIVKAIRNY